AGMRIDIRRRVFARATDCAAFGKNFFSARHHSSVCSDVSLPAGRSGEINWLKPAEKGGDICQTLFGRAPENGMLPRISNLERFLRREADQPLVARQPIFRKHADIDVNTNRGAWNTDGIGTVL